jgi:WD40 repeat protein
MNEHWSDNSNTQSQYGLLEARIEKGSLFPHFRRYLAIWIARLRRNNWRGFSGIIILLLAHATVVAQTAIPIQPKRVFGFGDVRTVAVSPDLRLMATAGQGGVFIWDVQSGTLLHRFPGIRSASVVEFSTDSKILYAADATAIRSWNAETAAHIRDYVGHTRAITRLSLMANGGTLLSASSDNTVRLWSTETGETINRIRVAGSTIMDAAVSPDGQKLVTVDTFLTNSVKVWDIATETEILALAKTNWTAQRCIFAPAGDFLTASPGGSVDLWNLNSGEHIRSFGGIAAHPFTILDIWLPNEATVAALCSNGDVYLWNLYTAELQRVISGNPIITGKGIPNEFLTIGADLDYTVQIRQLPGGDIVRAFKGHTTSTHTGVAFSPDGRYILSGGVESAVRLWNRETAEPVREFLTSPAGTATVAFSPDGSKVLSTIGFPTPAAQLWNTETGQLEREFKWTSGWPTGAALSKDGSKLAATAQDHRIRIFEAATGALLRTLSKPGATRLAFSPSAPLVVVGASDFSATIFNYNTGENLHNFHANAGPVTSVHFSPGGAAILIAWQDGLIRLYNALTLELQKEFQVQAAFLDAATFSPDGQYILTAENFPSYTATIWDAKTGQSVRSFPGHRWVVGAVAFSSDGRSILTGAEFVSEWSIIDLAARLQIEKLPNQIRLTWSHGQLERATQAQGPWERLINATSPFVTSSSSPAGPYRVRAD